MDAKTAIEFLRLKARQALHMHEKNAPIAADFNAIAGFIEQQAKDDESGIGLIAKERERQINQEGWTPEHDRQHVFEDLALAAACYAMPPYCRDEKYLPWPWHPMWWKPTPNDRIKELVKAGALIAAEIDRLRAEGGGR